MWTYLYAECVENSGQVFVVAPRIADSEGIERESVEELYAELKKIFPPDRVKALHGKLSAQEKRDIIDAFSKNEISALISTTVVEVGIDVPNANFMVIMDADSFGLAALHQLRGRVGRGGGKAYCLLYTAKEPDDGLILMTRTTDGMEIAEKDFVMRGAGDIFGLNQSGEGSIEGVTAQSLMTAKAIADRLNLKELERELKSEIEAFSLTDISIT
jgi:ATP-dependent DNA helicase RecG